MKILNGNPKNRVQLITDCLEDNRLSFGAKGIMCYLLANKLEHIDVANLVTRSKNGRDATRNIIRELIKHGYVFRETVKNSDGQFCGMQDYIYPSGRNLSD
jgi:hypothetical protein